MKQTFNCPTARHPSSSTWPLPGEQRREGGGPTHPTHPATHPPTHPPLACRATPGRRRRPSQSPQSRSARSARRLRIARGPGRCAREPESAVCEEKARAGLFRAQCAGPLAPAPPPGWRSSQQGLARGPASKAQHMRGRRGCWAGSIGRRSMRSGRRRAGSAAACACVRAAVWRWGGMPGSGACMRAGCGAHPAPPEAPAAPAPSGCPSPAGRSPAGQGREPAHMRQTQHCSGPAGWLLPSSARPAQPARPLYPTPLLTAMLACPPAPPHGRRAQAAPGGLRREGRPPEGASTARRRRAGAPPPGEGGVGSGPNSPAPAALHSCAPARNTPWPPPPPPAARSGRSRRSPGFHVFCSLPHKRFARLDRAALFSLRVEQGSLVQSAGGQEARRGPPAAARRTTGRVVGRAQPGSAAGWRRAAVQCAPACTVGVT